MNWSWSGLLRLVRRSEFVEEHWLNSVLQAAIERQEPHVSIQPSEDGKRLRAIAIRQSGTYPLLESDPFSESGPDVVEPLPIKRQAALLAALNRRRGPAVASTYGDDSALQEHWIDDRAPILRHEIMGYFHRWRDAQGKTHRLVKLAFFPLPAVRLVSAG